MEANPVRIIQYFDGEKQSIIPLFQRPYTWNKRNWESLWDDIMSHYDVNNYGASHFMGAVVSIPAKTVPVGVTKHLVIDGQQRLTTIAILLCALRDCSDERRAAQIQDYLVNRHYENTPDYLKLLPTQSDRKAYLEIVDDKIEPSSNKHLIRECYEHFINVLSAKEDDLLQIDHSKILDVVKSHLQVVMINLGETDDPYLIFESLNFKGEPLSQADLVRNYILMRFRYSLGDGGEQERVYREIWYPMECGLGSAIEDFLWHYAIKNGNDVKKQKIYSAIKNEFNEIKEPSRVENHILEMSKDAINYGRFLNPFKEPNREIQKELKLLNRLEATIAYPILIKLFSARDNEQFDDSVLIKCLKHINSFIVRRAVCTERRSALNRLFVNISSRIPTDISTVDEWIASELIKRVRSERWPDDSEFKEAIVYKNLYNTKAAKIVLEGIESYLAGKEVIDLASDKITIEHIMPQTLSLEWKIDPEIIETHRKYADTLGNLTLTGFNSELGNSIFSEKRGRYADSGIAMNRELCKFDKWTEAEIVARAQIIAEYAIKIWRRHSI